MPSAMPQRISCGRVPQSAPTSSAPMRMPSRSPMNIATISGRDTVDIGDVDADLVHAHDPDDRGALAVDSEMPAVGQRARQTLPIAERRGGNPACLWRTPGPPIADALALRNRPHLRDAAEDVHGRPERTRSWHGWVPVQRDAGAHQVVMHRRMREDRGTPRRMQQRVRCKRSEHVHRFEEPGVLGDREGGVVGGIGEVREDPGDLDTGRRFAKRGRERVQGLRQRSEPVESRVDLEVDTRLCDRRLPRTRARIPSASSALTSTLAAIRASSAGGGLQPTTRIGVSKPAARSPRASSGV